MTRLEKYKDILLPVDDIAYVEYRKQDKKTWSGHDYDEETGTFVRIRNGWFFNLVKISQKNVLDDFKKWYDETMSRIGQKGHTDEWVDEWHSFSSPPQQISQIIPEPEGGADVLSPAHCHTTTTSNGETVVTIFGGHSSTAPSYVKRDGTSCMSVQHDGMEHPL